MVISLRTFGLLTGLISALLSASASAATIDRFQADLQLLPDGDLLVVETLDVDFGPIPTHGIDREWPRDRPDVVGLVRWKIAPFEITVDGQPVPYTRQTVSGTTPLTRLRIGNPQRTLTGLHRYTLGYRVDQALGRANDRLHLRWPVLGQGWRVPVLDADIILSLPPSTTPLGELTVESLPPNLPDPLRVFEEDNTLPGWHLNFAALAPGRGAILVGTFDPNRFTPQTGIAPLSGLWPLLLTGGWPWLLVLGLMLVLWRRAGWIGLRPPPPIMVRYDLPEGVSPAEAGVVFDGYARFGDLAAEAVTMAQKGVLTVHAPAGRGSRGIFLRRTPGSSWAGDLLFRQYLMSALFSDGATFRPGEGDREGQIGSLRAAQNALYERATERGWFVEHPMQARDFARASLFLVALALLAVGAWLSPIAVRDLAPVLVPAALLLAFIALDAPELHRMGLTVFHLHPAMWLATLARRLAVSAATQAITRLFPASTPWLERLFQFMGGLALIEALHNSYLLHGTGWFWLMDPLIPTIFAALLLVGAAHFTASWSAKGRALRTHLLGLKAFMERADHDRLARMLRDDPGYLERALPYAVMFGLGARWGALFEGLAPLPTWYEGAAQGSDLGRGLELLAVGLMTPMLDGGVGHGLKGGGGGVW
ncbi:MAG: hypothetical protein COX57_01950 [Alphaproteobacteria bacterium CG_4_10_14_0_2_um_filter_63_37]|nr:MAG: hypothetical protein COX57_01950 [Alphaproteobacteria bacterium CG_4_10_14_0_2_um_filter_63_37]